MSWHFNIYKNKKVFVTGHTGFKCSWLTLWLNSLGAEVLGYSLPPNTEPAMYNIVNLKNKCKSVFGNILDKQNLEKTMKDFNPDIVFHLAAQSTVRFSYLEPFLTYETNVLGTLNVLEAARKCPSVKAFVNITTDKCYENKEKNQGYGEDEPMGGWDMYSSSKGCVEIMSASYRNSFLHGSKPFALATARAGNAIGGGDWAQDRLIPDCINFINENKSIEIRSPHAIRAWQHVLEPLSGYLLLGEKLLNQGEHYAQGFNFGPRDEDNLSVLEVTQKVVDYYGKGEIIVNKKDDLHEANILTLDIEKAKNILGWVPTYSVDEAIKETVEWYKKFYQESEQNCDMLDFTMNQINQFQNKINYKGAKNETVTGAIC